MHLEYPRQAWICVPAQVTGASRATPSVVEPARENPDLIFLHLIDESMFLIDASRPATGQFVFQGLGIAQTRIRITLNFTNQFHDSKRLRPVLFDPPGEILESR